jgi:hypothetical protein
MTEVLTALLVVTVIYAAILTILWMCRGRVDDIGQDRDMWFSSKTTTTEEREI